MPLFRRLLCAAAFALALPGASAAAATITEFPLPTSGHGPLNIAAAPGGNLWFSEAGASSLGTSTLAGAISETSGFSSATSGIAVAPDGDVWTTEPIAARITLLVPGGTPIEYPPGDGRPQDITAGPNGNMWYSESQPSRIAQITPGGLVTNYATGLTPNSSPQGITTGPDGNVWFTESANPGAIGRITPTGTITEYTTGLTANSDPSSITTGPDGNLWFTESANPGAIGRITPTGTITEYTTGLTANSDPSSIVAGADGNLWFTEQAAPGRLGRLTPDAPTATTQAATNVALTTATLTGTSNPSGAATTYHFEWGTTTGYGQQAPVPDAAVGSDTADHAVTQTLTGLAPGTTYHYRLVATSATGTTDGADMSFATAAAPTTVAPAPAATTPPPASVTTPPAPPAPTPPAPIPTPQVGTAAGVIASSGTVTYSCGGAGSTALTATVSTGCTINATSGSVTLAFATPTGLQTDTLSGGSFTINQNAAGFVEITLAAPAPVKRKGVSARAARTTRPWVPAHLWSTDRHGHLRVRSRYSVATADGTAKWETSETYGRTLTIVTQGEVSVLDLHRHKSVAVRAGRRYLAKR